MQSKLAIQLIGSAQPLSAGPLVREIELHCLPLLLYGLIPLPLQQVLPIVNRQFKSDKYGPMLDQATLRFAEIQLAEQSNSEAGNTQSWRLICDWVLSCLTFLKQQQSQATRAGGKSHKRVHRTHEAAQVDVLVGIAKEISTSCIELLCHKVRRIIHLRIEADPSNKRVTHAVSHVVNNTSASHKP